MSNVEFERHIDRLRLATVDQLTAKDVAKFITKHTFLGGKNYSFVDHEYQERIVSDDSQETVTRKCSQVGLSEVSLRRAMALCCLIPKYTILYTFPTATFASNYVKTRFDPVIAESEYLRSASSNSDIDNSEVKQFGNSYLYVRGCSTANQAVATPGDHLIHDEYDFSDPVTASQYQSRLTHSPHKRRDVLSTPTVPGGPIDAAFLASRRHFCAVKCDKCGHTFIPDYFKDVRLPGLTVDLRSITKSNLHRYDHNSAFVVCPKCGRAPSLQVEHRRWICENPSENHVAIGHQVSPFDAPNIITPGYLIEASTKYVRYTDFINVNLGLPAEDADSGITPEDVDNALVRMDSSPFTTHVMGGDMGLLCRIFIAGIARTGELIIVHTENIPIGQFRARYAELCRKYRVTVKVLDSQPYVETLLNLQQTDPNLLAAYFVNRKGLETYSVTTRDENLQEGKTGLHQVSVNKNACLDLLMAELRDKKIKLVDGPDTPMVKEQLTNMKRAKKVTDDGIQSIWIKPANGDDHAHHALLYTWLAAQLRGTLTFTQHPMPMVTSFKMRPAAPAQRVGTGMRGA